MISVSGCFYAIESYCSYFNHSVFAQVSQQLWWVFVYIGQLHRKCIIQVSMFPLGKGFWAWSLDIWSCLGKYTQQSRLTCLELDFSQENIHLFCYKALNFNNLMHFLVLAVWKQSGFWDRKLTYGVTPPPQQKSKWQIHCWIHMLSNAQCCMNKALSHGNSSVIGSMF